MSTLAYSRIWLSLSVYAGVTHHVSCVTQQSWKPAQQDEAQAEAQPQGRITRPVSVRAHQGGGEVSQARQHCPRTFQVCVCVLVVISTADTLDH